MGVGVALMPVGRARSVIRKVAASPGARMARRKLELIANHCSRIGSPYWDDGGCCRSANSRPGDNDTWTAVVRLLIARSSSRPAASRSRHHSSRSPVTWACARAAASCSRAQVGADVDVDESEPNRSSRLLGETPPSACQSQAKGRQREKWGAVAARTALSESYVDS